MQARILDKQEYPKWDEFQRHHPLSSIGQSSGWANFQAELAIRGKSRIVVLEENGQVVGGSVIVRHKLPKGLSWLYSSRGPLLDYSSKNLQAQMDTLLQEIKKIGKAEKAIFYRIDPPMLLDQKMPNLSGFKQNCHGFQPEHTLILDLEPSEDEILAQMKQKGRYNIRLAEKKGVTVRKGDEQDLDKFYEILKETTSRDGFYGHTKSFYQIMLKELGENAELYIAEYQGEMLAGLIVTYHNDTAIYYYGASSNAHRNLMAPYLLQWTVIQIAKKRGYKYYDFLGISPPGAKSHAWQGVTAFKQKFGGQALSYHHAQEYTLNQILHPLYRVYKKW